MKILELIKKDRNKTQKIMAEELKLSRGSAITLNLKQLKDKNVIEKIGSDKKRILENINIRQEIRSCLYICIKAKHDFLPEKELEKSETISYFFQLVLSFF